MDIDKKDKSTLLNIANELFKDSRSLTIEEQKAIDNYFRSKSKDVWVVRVKEDDKEEDIDE